MEKRGLKVIMLLAVAAMMQACSGSVENDAKADVDSTAALTDTLPKPGAPIEKGDAQFIFNAASGGISEVDLGKLAQQKGKNLRVKNFGKMMVSDHTKADDKLMVIAKSKNISLPAVPDAHDQKMINELSKKSGAAFDKAYIKDMISDHEDDIKEFTFASKNCSDADIKSFAKKTLSVLKNHLDAINTIHDSMQ